VRGILGTGTNPTDYLKLLSKSGVKQGFGVSLCVVENEAGSNVVRIVETLDNEDSSRALFNVY